MLRGDPHLFRTGTETVNQECRATVGLGRLKQEGESALVPYAIVSRQADHLVYGGHAHCHRNNKGFRYRNPSIQHLFIVSPVSSRVAEPGRKFFS